ncbi:MAG: hypothetical protein F6K31_19805 [Symploca sp. SIO2G7]|nr:hypothetical protein [Symploca sp. SIO2G7]
MNRRFLLTFFATLLMVQSPLFVKSARRCQLTQPYSQKLKVQLNSRQDKPPVTGRPDDRKPAGTYARPMPPLL